MQSAYRAALARIHDDGFGFIATDAAKLLVAGLRQNGFRSGRVVELACGGGISSRVIADAGFDVSGFDLSPQMIELARERVPEAEFAVESIYDVDIPPCVAVTAVGEAFNYRFDARAGFTAMCGVFESAHAAIEPGGILLFDVAQPGRALPRLEHTVYEGPGWQVAQETIEDPARGLLERRITARTGARLENEDTEIHSLALFDHEAVFAALREAGFDPATLAAYGDHYHFSAGHGGFYSVRV